jgi:AcrR family transcriptional regulator/predicted DNA-binding transcriptional regulator AlpA
MVNTGTRKLLRIGELSRRTGISTSAINYYVREGLLPPPLKTAPNMAYYDPGYVDMVNSIKILQREKGLKLEEIKELLEQGQFNWPEGFPPEDFSGATGTAAGTRRALDRRKHIMGVAARVFSEKGYYATTIADLAQAAGIAKGTIYWYFNNKRAIMMAILDDMSREITSTFAQVLRDAPDGLEALLLCIEPALVLLEKHGSIYLMYFLEIGSTDSSIQQKFRQIYSAVHAGARIAIERGMKEGKIRKVDSTIAAYGVMGLVERVSEVSGLSEVKIPIERKAEEAREMVRRALRTGPATRSKPAKSRR